MLLLPGGKCVSRRDEVGWRVKNFDDHMNPLENNLNKLCDAEACETCLSVTIDSL